MFVYCISTQTGHRCLFTQENKDYRQELILSRKQHLYVVDKASYIAMSEEFFTLGGSLP